MTDKRGHRETLVLSLVQEALAYAIGQLHNFDLTSARVLIQEFWHSLNRKGIIRNEEVDELIKLTVKTL